MMDVIYRIIWAIVVLALFFWLFPILLSVLPIAPPAPLLTILYVLIVIGTLLYVFKGVIPRPPA